MTESLQNGFFSGVTPCEVGDLIDANACVGKFHRGKESIQELSKPFYKLSKFRQIYNIYAMRDNHRR